MTVYDTCSYCGTHIDAKSSGELDAKVQSHEASCDQNPNHKYGRP